MKKRLPVFTGKRENIYIFSIEYIYSLSIVGRIFSSSQKIAVIGILSIIFKGIMIFTGYLVH